MTDRELDERIAMACAFKVESRCGLDYAVCGDAWLGLGNSNGVPRFSPSTSVDALRKWVLPELKRRGLTRKFDDVVGIAATCSFADPEAFDILSCEPAVLAAAALEVLEGDNAG